MLTERTFIHCLKHFQTNHSGSFIKMYDYHIPLNETPSWKVCAYATDRTSLSLYSYWPPFYLQICQLSPRKFFTLFLPYTFTLYNHFCAFLCRFYSIYCAVILHYLQAVFVIHLYVFLWHAVNHFLNVMVGFAFLESSK